MKNIITKITILTILALLPVLTIFAQPPAPDPSTGVGPIQQLECTNVPVGNGFFVLLSLALAYGIYQYLKERKINQAA